MIDLGVGGLKMTWFSLGITEYIDCLLWGNEDCPMYKNYSTDCEGCPHYPIDNNVYFRDKETDIKNLEDKINLKS